jgi:hypothetical protein
LPVVFNHVKSVTPAFEVVALAGHELALGLSVLVLKFGLLSADPR